MKLCCNKDKHNITIWYGVSFLCVFSPFVVDQLVVPNVTIATLSALHKNYIASRAVDGVFLQNITFCSHTDDAAGITEAWVRIDLLGIYSIKYVKFYYRKYLGYKGYCLFVKYYFCKQKIKKTVSTFYFTNVHLQLIFYMYILFKYLF